MKKLLTYLKAYKKESILAPLFKLLEASFELFVPLVVASIIDRSIGERDRGYVVQMTLVLVVLGLVGLVCAVTAQYFAAKASVGFAGGLRRALFEKIQTFSYAQLDKIGTNTLINRMTGDVNQVQSALNLTLRLFLRSPVVVFGAMIMAFTIDLAAALIFVITIPLLSVVVFGIMLISIPLYRTVQEKLDRVLGITRENLTGVRVIRAFCKEEDEVEEFDRRNDDLNKMQRRVGMLSALMNPLTLVIVNLAIIALIHTGADLVNDSTLTQGEVVALYNYMSQILIELVKLANLIITMTRGAASLSRIGKILDADSAPAPIAGKQEASPYAVELRDVSLAYPGGGDEALSHINLAVKKGETVGIIGGTGSGKTSLVNLLPRFYDCTGGTVLVDGLDVKAWDTDALRKKIAVVPQKAQLFAGTIRDNLRFGAPDADDETLRAALSAAQALDIIEKKGGLDAVVEQNGRNLSGGQRQRLTIARALATRPEILILDDSASALDYATDARLRAAIRELPSSPTVFIVSQRTASLRHADQILVLEDGEAVAVGRHEELLETCPVYGEIHYAQYPRDAKEVG
ncbi:MAG: ABC transporter ATP-binding protein [Clostridia bacterium]|nr:ABC transporter ATP-binding protein [Clostridia bacterium]